MTPSGPSPLYERHRHIGARQLGLGRPVVKLSEMGIDERSRLSGRRGLPAPYVRVDVPQLQEVEDNTVLRFSATRTVNANDLRDHVEQRWPFMSAGPVDPLNVPTAVRRVDVR